MRKNKKLTAKDVDTKIEFKVFIIQELLAVLKNWKLLLKSFIFLVMFSGLCLILFADITCKNKFGSINKKSIIQKESTK